MIIDCISDLHGHYPELEGGDLLIVAGDLTASSNEQEYLDFYNWIRDQKYHNKIVIAGNHDTLIEREGYEWMGLEDAGFQYLCDSGTEFEYIEPVIIGSNNGEATVVFGYKKTLKIWGSPWTKSFPAMNPHCKAFTVDTEEDLAEKFEKIPHDVDILITHSPPRGILDTVRDYMTGETQHVGSRYLHAWFKYVARPRLHVFGHVHEGYGVAEVFSAKDGAVVQSVNASHVNEHYQPVNKPIRVIL